jgi:hypothetical protein
MVFFCDMTPMVCTDVSDKYAVSILYVNEERLAASIFIVPEGSGLLSC